MTINTHLSQTDYVKANLVLLYSKWSMKFITGVGIFMFLGSLLTLFYDEQYGSGSTILVAFFIMSWIPALTWFNARRNYSTNNRISEPIDYTIENESLTVKGESFTVTLTWDKLYRVSKTKNWVLIWQSKQVANLIPRKNFDDIQIGYLKNILVKHNVKNNL